MKSIKYIMLSLVASSCVACSDFLDEDLKSYYNADEYAKTQSEIKLAMNGAYDAIGSNYVSGFNAAQLPTDLQKRPAWSQEAGIGSYTYSASNAVFASIWRAHYSAIKDCNYVMQSILNLPGGEETYKTYLAQVRGLRGYLYYNLVRMFGEVPIVEFIAYSPSDKILTPKRATMAECLEFIIADLEYASKFSIQESDNDYKFGRFSRIAALGFLAKLHLWIGSVSDRDDTVYLEESSRHFDLAKEYAKKVIDAGVYTLVDYYPDAFDYNNEAVGRKEVIFGVVHNNDSQTGGSVGMIFGLSGDQDFGGSQGMTGSTNYHSTLYDLSDSVRRMWNCPRAKVVAASEEHPNGYLYGYDYSPAYLVDGTNELKESDELANFSSTFSFGKFRRYPLANPSTYSSGSFGVDEPILRFADILLIYAEAYNEVEGDPGYAQPSIGLSLDGTNIVSAFDAVNVIRKRARIAAEGKIHDNVMPRVYDYSAQDYYKRTLEIDSSDDIGYGVTSTFVIKGDGTDLGVTVDETTVGCVPDWSNGFYGYMPKSQTSGLVTLCEVYKERNYSGSEYEVFKQEILNERARELVCEMNDRWFDLTRRGVLQQMCERCATTTNPFLQSATRTEDTIGGGNGYFNPDNIRDYMWRMPIPTSEMDANPNLTQNPGY